MLFKQANNTYILDSDCTWSEWVFIDECSKSCGVGWIERRRSKTVLIDRGGRCRGESTEDLACNVQKCPGG